MIRCPLPRAIWRSANGGLRRPSASRAGAQLGSRRRAAVGAELLSGAGDAVAVGDRFRTRAAEGRRLGLDLDGPGGRLAVVARAIVRARLRGRGVEIGR